jgi:MHS family proline/betaine transporter-like MFS transporter
MTDSSAGANNARGTDNILPGSVPPGAAPQSAKKSRQLPRRRHKVSEVNLVNNQMHKKALGGTIVGNTNER